MPVIEIDGDVPDEQAIQIAQRQMGQQQQANPFQQLAEALGPIFQGGGAQSTTPTLPKISGGDVAGLGLQGTQQLQGQAQQSIQDQVMQRERQRISQERQLESSKDRAQQLKIQQQDMKNRIAEAKMRAQLEEAKAEHGSKLKLTEDEKSGVFAGREAQTEGTRLDNKRKEQELGVAPDLLQSEAETARARAAITTAQAGVAPQLAQGEVAAQQAGIAQTQAGTQGQVLRNQAFPQVTEAEIAGMIANTAGREAATAQTKAQTANMASPEESQRVRALEQQARHQGIAAGGQALQKGKIDIQRAEQALKMDEREFENMLKPEVAQQKHQLDLAAQQIQNVRATQGIAEGVHNIQAMLQDYEMKQKQIALMMSPEQQARFWKLEEQKLRYDTKGAFYNALGTKQDVAFALKTEDLKIKEYAARIAATQNRGVYATARRGNANPQKWREDIVKDVVERYTSEGISVPVDPNNPDGETRELTQDELPLYIQEMVDAADQLYSAAGVGGMQQQPGAAPAETVLTYDRATGTMK